MTSDQITEVQRAQRSSESGGEAVIEADALALARAILDDLSDRAGVPEWLGEHEDDDAQGVIREKVKP